MVVGRLVVWCVERETGEGKRAWGGIRGEVGDDWRKGFWLDSTTRTIKVIYIRSIQRPNRTSASSLSSNGRTRKVWSRNERLLRRLAPSGRK